MDISSSLREHIGKNRVAVAYSGGFDSTLLSYLLSQIDPDGYVNVFVDSPLVSERQRRAAVNIAEHLGLRLIVTELDWNELPGVRENTAERCYHCKRAMYTSLIDIASDIGMDVCADGENANDLGDCRPGRRAAKELGIISPFAELGIGRDAIEKNIISLKIPEVMIKDTCMATRLRMGTPFSDVELRLVEDCESSVRAMTGVKQLRIRLDGNKAAVLTSPEEISDILVFEDKIISKLLSKGLEASIDRKGYRG